MPKLGVSDTYKLILWACGLSLQSLFPPERAYKRKAKMIAFYSDGTRQVKAYDHGSDWQLLDGKSERWFSTWSNDRRASLQAAFSRFLGHDVNPNQIHGLKDIKA